MSQASLVMIPSGYKEDVVYSQIPTNGNGDLSFTRASNGTRINSAGLVEVCPWNLVEYSEQFNNAIWTKTNISISANTTTSPNGTTTADTLTGDGSANAKFIFQQSALVSGTTYSFSCYIKKGTNNFAQLIAGSVAFGLNVFANFDLDTGVVGSIGSSTTASIDSVGNGWYRCTMNGVCNVTGSNPSLIVCLVDSSTALRASGNSLSTTIFLYGAQLNIGSTAKPYFPTTDRLNVPRLTYQNGGGGCPSLLLEKQSTNVILRSEEFDNAAWTKISSSVTANSTISPDGTQNADTLTGDGTSSTHSVFQSASLISGANYTISVYAKKNTNNFLQIYGFSTGYGVNSWANFDLNNGVVGSVGSSTTASIVNVGNGWYRCTISIVAVSTATDAFVFNLITSATSSRGENSTLSTSVFLWGCQLEAGAYPTTYIPTTTASATRIADSFSRNNIFTNGLITSSGGTWFVELRNNVAYTGGITQAQLLGLGNDVVGATANNFYIACSDGTIVRIWKQIAGTITVLYTTTTSTTKIAIKWNGTTADVFVNGTKQVSATSFTPTALESLRTVAVQHPYFIQQMALFPTPLSDTDCTTLTT